MTTRTSILSLTTLAALSLIALAPSQASAWDRGGYGGQRFEGGFRPVHVVGRSGAPQMCEGLPSRGLSHLSQLQPVAPMQGYRPAPPAQSYGPAPQQGYAPPPRAQGYVPPPADSYEEEPEARAQQPSPNNGPAAYTSKELQK